MRYRKNVVVVHLDDNELESLNKQVALTGLKREGVLRNLITGLKVHAKPSAEYIRLIQELSGIGNNIDQITHLANRCGTVSPQQIRQVNALLADIWHCVQCELR